MILTEAEVVRIFTAWLHEQGWTVAPGPDKWLDIYATRGSETLHVEAKGATKDDGASADILWGQLLRRMVDVGTPGVRYAMVLPEAIKRHALRVPAVVRDRLGVEVYTVTEDGAVHGPTPRQTA